LIIKLKPKLLLGTFLCLILIFFGVSSVFAQTSEILPPLKQLSQGILPNDVVCRSDFEIIFNPLDGRPACVKMLSVKKLVQRGWLNIDYPLDHLDDLKKVHVTKSIPDKPNIILIMTDDVSVNMLNIMLENKLMPNLQEHFIDKGTTFSNSFVTTSLCCPSRATSLTGLYAHNHGVLTNAPVIHKGKLVANGGFEAFNDSTTIATLLNKTGYETGFIGKYLNGYPGKKLGYVPPGWTNWEAFQKPVYKMYESVVNENGKIIETEEYKTNYLAQRAVKFLNDSEPPFFLYISTLVAHGTSGPTSIKCKLNSDNQFFRSFEVFPEYQNILDNVTIPHSPSFNEEDVSDKPPGFALSIENIDCVDTVFRHKSASLASVDDLIGKIYDALLKNNFDKNTVLIFTSDNGFQFGEHRLLGKNLAYEESIRVPLFIHLPNIPSQTVHSFVINNDLVPTIADLAGATPTIKEDGVSLLPVLMDPTKKLRNAFLIENFKSGIFHDAIRGENFLYTEYGKRLNFTELYNLNSDPYQENNLADCMNNQCKFIEPFHTWLSELKKCGNGTCQKIENQDDSQFIDFKHLNLN